MSVAISSPGLSAAVLLLFAVSCSTLPLPSEIAPKTDPAGASNCPSSCQAVALSAIERLEASSGRSGCAGHRRVATDGQARDNHGGFVELWTVETTCGSQIYAVAYNEHLGRVLVADRATAKEIRLDVPK